MNPDPEALDPELARLLEELCREIKDLLQYYSASRVVEILAERRRYRENYHNNKGQAQ